MPGSSANREALDCWTEFPIKEFSGEDPNNDMMDNVESLSLMGGGVCTAVSRVTRRSSFRYQALGNNDNEQDQLVIGKKECAKDPSVQAKEDGDGMERRRCCCLCCGGGGGAIRAELSSAGDVVMAHRLESSIHTRINNNVQVILGYILCIAYTPEYMQKKKKKINSTTSYFNSRPIHRWNSQRPLHPRCPLFRAPCRAHCQALEPTL